MLVCGAGPVGIAAVMAAKIAGCSVIAALDIREIRLDAARALGAGTVVKLVLIMLEFQPYSGWMA